MDASIKIQTPSRVKTMAFYAACALLFWFAEFLFQYMREAPGEAEQALIASFAFAGGTLIGVVLFSSSIFKWFPRTAQYWRLRRYLGVWAAIFIAFHAFFVYLFAFNYNLGELYFSLNPFRNPVVFGSLAFLVLLAMALTSSDWAMQALTPRKWKILHRCIYIAYPIAILHFTLLAPNAVETLPGMALILAALLAVSGQLYWFFAMSSRKKFQSLGFFVGLGIIAAVVIIFAVAYR